MKERIPYEKAQVTIMDFSSTEFMGLTNSTIPFSCLEYGVHGSITCKKVYKPLTPPPGLTPEEGENFYRCEEVYPIEFTGFLCVEFTIIQV